MVPLHLRGDSEVFLEYWLEGAARRGANVEFQWNDGATVAIAVEGDQPNQRLRLPAPSAKGHFRLKIALRCPPHGAAVLDRVVAAKPDSS